MITIETTLGNIQLELDMKNTPITAQNFINYVQSNFYDNTIFHRVIAGFMIQGGGMTADMQSKETQAPIQNEANHSGPNLRGTIAMARTNDPDSATAQFFINVADNTFLNFKSESIDGWGYCVFGRVVSGMDVVEKIEKVQTHTSHGHSDVPIEPIHINNVQITEPLNA